MASQFPGDRPIHVTPPPPGGPSAGLVDRVRNILVSPRTEWPRIDADPIAERDLYMRYVLPLAAIPPVFSFLGQLAFPTRVFGVVIRVSPVSAAVGLVFTYLMSIAAVFIIARIVDALAPTFQGQKSILNATKLVVFSSVPGWIAGVANILPALGGLITLIAGIYGLYLLYLGLPVLMRSPGDKTVPYMLVTAVAVIAVLLVLGLVTGVIGGTLAGLFAPTPGTITITP